MRLHLCASARCRAWASSLPPALDASTLPACRPCSLQDVDFSVSGREDEARYDLEVGQRVLVSLDPARMMAFAYDEIDGTAAVA